MRLWEFILTKYHIMQTITGQLVDILEKRIYPAIITIENGKILRIDPLLTVTRIVDGIGTPAAFIMPGFIDAHVHIESSMLIPSEFAKIAAIHGTVGTVSDPHEIANVCGVAGVEYMIENGNMVSFKFNFGAPSCVPATNYETAGAALDLNDVSALLQRNEIRYLSEMMNFPGVLLNDDKVIKKIEAARSLNKPVDGHAPGLRGEEVRRYIEAGISTDHECFTKEEALDKLKYGMKILIREGSAAKNFEALIELLHDYPESIMFCSDDKHPDSLISGHINQLCARAVEKGIDIFNVLQAACVNPVLHYQLDIGLLREGDSADFIVVEDLKTFKVLQTYIDGELVAERGKWRIGIRDSEVTTKEFGVRSQEFGENRQKPGVKNEDLKIINNFNCSKKVISDFLFPLYTGDKWNLIPVIEALEGQLITNKLTYTPKVIKGNIVSDPDRDILKIVVVNRYSDAPVAKALIKNIGLKVGAIASSVAHDSHNIVAVGVDDESLCKAVNLVIEKKAE